MFGTTIDVAGLYSYRDNLQISHGVKAGNTIYISGQVALDPEGNVVGKGDAEAQAEYIWSNIEKVLQEAASMVSWPCSEETSFTTGEVFDLSGGRSTY